MVHETTIIKDGAKIASDVEVGPFCFIGKDVKIDSGCKIESNVILKGKLHIKNNVKVFSFATVGKDNSNITVGENTHIREFVQIGSQESISEEPKKIIIGSDNFLMGYVQILDGVKLGKYCILTNAVRLYENVKCEDRVVVGGLSTVESNNTIGEGVMIGGASYVNTDIPPYTLVEGNRANIKGLNVVGLRRMLENKDDIEDIKAIFKKILGEKVNKDLAEKISKKHENKYVQKLASFVANSNL